MKLAIVDLAYGNIGSIKLAFERLGVSPVVTADAEEIAGADRVVLPGVGAAGHAMNRLAERGLRDCLRSLEQPALGICLGMQLLFDRSAEADTECLGIIAGKVRQLQPAPGMNLVCIPAHRVLARYVRITATQLWYRKSDYVFAHQPLLPIRRIHP